MDVAQAVTVDELAIGRVCPNLGLPGLVGCLGDFAGSSLGCP